jgi:hypothetical protein
MMRLHAPMFSFAVDGGYDARVEKEGEGNEARETSLGRHGNERVHQGTK